jgi:hypothetical protein
MENSYRRTIRNLNTDESAQANKSSLEEDQTVKNDERKSVRKNLKRFDYLYFQESSVCTNKQWLANLESRQRRLTTGLNLRGRSDRDNLESEQLLFVSSGASGWFLHFEIRIDAPLHCDMTSLQAPVCSWVVLSVHFRGRSISVS